MKKLAIFISAVALVCFSVPAMAADDWSFYANARMATFWVDDDFGDTVTPPADDNDADLQWDLQGNSRFGGRVKHEAVAGHFELGLKGTDGGDVDVGTRRIYGTWNFGAGTLKVGKDYTPINQFLSGQVFGSDNGLLGSGFLYGGRPGNISLTFGGFEVALITPKSDTISFSAGADVDEYLPKIEAKYGMGFDTWNFAIRGGAQTYEVEDVVSTVTSLTDDVDVTSYFIGADGGVNFGPAYVKAAISYGQNMGNARWTGGAGAWDNDDDLDDNDTIQGGLVVGMKVSDMLTLEAGGGYRVDDLDGNNTQKQKTWAGYGQAVVQLAPGVFIIPEFGYFDNGESVTKSALDDLGDRWYAGAKWQINF
ncbi:MAG: hypothetical protein HKO68_19425 [Desulfobacterales bacterium]|nr:hypothetical protein [Desulfobacterales bacterium]